MKKFGLELAQKLKHLIVGKNCYIYKEEVAGSTESTYKLQNNSTNSLTTHISLYNTSFICAIIFVLIYIHIQIYIICKSL